MYNITMGNTPNYKYHEDIPESMVSYLLTVADCEHIQDIDIEDINSYLSGLHEYERELIDDSQFVKHKRWVFEL